MSYAAESRAVRSTLVKEQSRQSRRETLWAWASLLVLIVAWDVSSRLDERASVPRVRIAHAADVERPAQRIESAEL